jgi:hypothetical protein
VKHRGVEYGVEEDRPGFWRWIIYQKMEDGQKVIGEAKYPSREAAVSACIEEINMALTEADAVVAPSNFRPPPRWGLTTSARGAALD